MAKAPFFHDCSPLHDQNICAFHIAQNVDLWNAKPNRVLMLQLKPRFISKSLLENQRSQQLIENCTLDRQNLNKRGLLFYSFHNNELENKNQLIYHLHNEHRYIRNNAQRDLQVFHNIHLTVSFEITVCFKRRSEVVIQICTSYIFDLQQVWRITNLVCNDSCHFLCKILLTKCSARSCLHPFYTTLKN